MKHWTAIINGASVDPASGERFTVDEPATGLPLATVSACGPEEVDAAVRAAKDAFHGDWRWRSSRDRGRLLRSVADLIRRHADELAQLETREMGKPLEQARSYDLVSAIETFEFYGGLAESLNGEAVLQGPITTYTVVEPYGTVGAVIPFNWPPVHLAAKAAPALAAGNTVVIKPAEQAPLTVLRMVELINTVLPAGAVNAVPGLGPSAGAALISHRDIGKLTFTGSTETGKRVLAAAAANVTPALLELGGKNALIVFDDADLGAAVGGAIEGMFFNQGEACTAASRILVADRIAAEFMERFCGAVRSLRLGDGLDPSTELGPLVTREQQARVEEYVRIGAEEGAVIVAEGALPTDPRLANGFFVRPIVFSAVSPSMRIAREEIFGPVTVVMTFRDEREAVDLANDSDFGLVAAVFTSNIERAQRLSRLLDAGVVFINNYHRGFLGTPFGGMKASGYGREHAIGTLREYSRSKSIRLPSGLGEIPMWQAAAARAGGAKEKS